MRVLPDCQVGLVLKHVLRAELLLVLANDPDNRVRTALIKVNNVLVQYIWYNFYRDTERIKCFISIS